MSSKRRKESKPARPQYTLEPSGNRWAVPLVLLGIGAVAGAGIAVPPVRRGDGLRDDRRAQAGLGGDQEASPARHAPAPGREARAGVARVSAERRAGGPARLFSMVELGPRRRLASSARSRQRHRRAG